MRLEHKIAVVTGGTSGIGRAIVERFAAEGATVFFTGRRAALGKEVALATGATFLEADVASDGGAEQTLLTAAQVNGRVDILVNNAGCTFPVCRLEALPLETLDVAMAVMVRGALAHIKHVAARMRAQRQGSIINIASIAGHRVGYSGSIAYEAAKAALLHLTRRAAVELGEDGVRVNSISPGGIATGIFGKSVGLGSDAAEASAVKVEGFLAGMQPIPRAGLALDVAQAALFLASDESTFISGEDVLVDGGLICGRRYSELAAGAQGLKSMLQ